MKSTPTSVPFAPCRHMPPPQSEAALEVEKFKVIPGELSFFCGKRAATRGENMAAWFIHMAIVLFVDQQKHDFFFGMFWVGLKVF